MVMCSTRMKGPDLTGEKINLGIKDEEAPLIKVHWTCNSLYIIIVALLDQRRPHDKEETTDSNK